MRQLVPGTRFLATLVLLVSLPFAARAQGWNETVNGGGDAGALVATAQLTAGNGPLTTITGTLGSTQDVDLYCIDVTDPAQFSAHLVCTVLVDPDLWLFDPSGKGVALNDGCSASWTQIPPGFVVTSGTYYLGISADGRDALSAGGPMWLSPWVSNARPPDGPGAAGTLIGWGGSGTVTVPSYTVTLTGAGYCDTATPARTGTWGRLKVIYR